MMMNESPMKVPSKRGMAEDPANRASAPRILTSREITSVAAKLISAYLLFHIVLSIPIWVAVADRQFGSAPVVWALGGISVILGLLAIRVVRRFANRLLPVDGERLDLHASAFQIERLLLRCLGLYFAVGTVRDIVRHAITLSHWRYKATDLTLTYVDFFTGIAVFLVALSLIARPVQWMRAMQKLRRL